MRPPKHDEQGLVGVILTIVIVWALIAVVMLTRTLLAAQQIDTTVKDIRGSVGSIGSHLNTGCNSATNTNCTTNALPALNTTASVAADIDKAAMPLSDQAKQALASLTTIDGTAKAILANASSIHTTVQSINSLVGSIGASVNSINGSLSAVNGDAGAIQQQVAGINNRATTIIGQVTAIKGDTGNINNLAAGILATAKGICADQPVKLLGIPGLLNGLVGQSVCVK